MPQSKLDGEVQRLLDTIDAFTHTGLRDRAVLVLYGHYIPRGHNGVPDVLLRLANCWRRIDC